MTNSLYLLKNWYINISLKTLRYLDREVNHAWDTIFGTNTVSANTGKYLWGTLKEVETDMMQNLVESQGLISGAGNKENEAHQ